jgi:putative aldouronate transport system substrate-binding protein
MFCAKDGDVIYSPTSDQFREYLTMMHRWYEEGIISKDFATDGDWMFMNSEYQSMMANGDTGIISLGAGLYSEFESVGLEFDDNYTLAGIVNARQNADIPAGNTPSARASDAIFSVSANNGNEELACRWCDFWYTEVGSTLATYGIEGESYTLNADGSPEYTDYILNNPDYSDRSMKNLYSFNASSLVDPAKNLSGISDHGLAAVEVWSQDTPSDSFTTISMSTLSLTDDESTEYGVICADAQTYCLENVLKFINGDLDIERDWDNYVENLERMGVDDATAIVQAAFDRYQSR